MTVFAQTAGQRNIATISLADGNEYDLITVDTGAMATLESILACNTGAGTRNFSMVIDVNGSSFSVLHEAEVATKTFLHLKNHNLPISSTSVLRVKSDAAGLDVTAVYILNHSGTKG